MTGSSAAPHGRRGWAAATDLGDHAQALAVRGCDFVLRCYSRDPVSRLDRREAVRLDAAGLAIGVRWLDPTFCPSRRQGLLDGADALCQARDVGQPAGSAIYFDAGGEGALDEPTIGYFAGVRAALGGAGGYRIGALGAAARCAGLLDRRLAALGWTRSPASASAHRHALLEWPATVILIGDAAFELAPVLGRPERDAGLFRLSAHWPAAAGRATPFRAEPGRPAHLLPCVR